MKKFIINEATDNDFYKSQILISRSNEGDKLIHVNLNEMDNGRKFIEFREYYLDDDQNENPTRKGLNIPIDQINDLIKSLNFIKKEYINAPKNNPQDDN